tara:strand:- start:1085 stop:1252 length:168 start_codon:yes stop_codon:yes gene_type:complete
VIVQIQVSREILVKIKLICVPALTAEPMGAAMMGGANVRLATRVIDVRTIIRAMT